MSDLSSPTTPPPASQLNLIGLVVADMARFLAFYRLLGLDFAAVAESEEHVEYQLTPLS
jgi:catechol 2,3-dioxygenase-like lactoylglutathione lyase family enzyme